LDTPLEKITFAVVDLETTGLSAQRDTVVEVAAVKLKNGIIGESFQSLVHTSFIPFPATQVHGIDADMVRDAPRLGAVRDDFLRFVQDCVLVGHNIKHFDMRFLTALFSVPEGRVCVDTLRLSRALFSRERSHSLISVAQRMGMGNQNFHRALDDATVTARIFVELLKAGKPEFKILKDIVAW
jgi:exonuclease, DNA polymerase III, epsilon subunit family